MLTSLVGRSTAGGHRVSGIISAAEKNNNGVFHEWEGEVRSERESRGKKKRKRKILCDLAGGAGTETQVKFGGRKRGSRIMNENARVGPLTDTLE
jgi:hypothetical protein